MSSEASGLLCLQSLFFFSCPFNLINLKLLIFRALLEADVIGFLGDVAGEVELLWARERP